jgi:putative flippase GtrA
MTPASDLAYRVGTAARRPANWVQLLKFGLVGGSGYLINLGVFALLAGSLGVHHAIAAVGAFAVAVTNNFLWNRYWTFGPGEGPAHFQAARFFAVSLASLGLNIAILELLISNQVTGELTAQAIAVAAAMPFNFIGNKLWTFT